MTAVGETDSGRRKEPDAVEALLRETARRADVRARRRRAQERSEPRQDRSEWLRAEQETFERAEGADGGGGGWTGQA